MRYPSVEYFERLEQEQIAFMASAGGNLDGYITRYGDYDSPRADGKPMCGEGGRAIYQADLAELQRIQKELSRQRDKREGLQMLKNRGTV
jgi:hypothetical protein